MAYPIICKSCLRGDHADCEEFDKEMAAKREEHPELAGSWFCVCAHGGEESEFQKRIRERDEAK